MNMGNHFFQGEFLLVLKRNKHVLFDLRRSKQKL